MSNDFRHFSKKILDKKIPNAIMQSKGGDKMKLHHYYLFLILVLPIFSIILNSVLTTPTLTKIFFYSLLTHTVISLYTIYSLYEVFVLHEKQGSKLSLSKGKITSDWR